MGLGDIIRNMSDDAKFEVIGKGLIAAYFLAIAGGIIGIKAYEDWEQMKKVRGLEQRVVTEKIDTEIRNETDYPYCSYSVYRWHPVDVTYRVKEGLKREGDELVFEPAFSKEKFVHRESISPDGNWWVSNIIRGKKKNHYSSGLLCTSDDNNFFEYRFNVDFLFDKKSGRIYAIDLGDNKMLDQHERIKDFSINWSRKPFVSNNGLCLYLAEYKIVYDSGVERKEFAYIAADPVKGRKYVHTVHPNNRGFAPLYPRFRLEGDKVVFDSGGKEYVLDIEKNTFQKLRRDKK